MTGNIWGGQQSLPHSWAHFPSEFNTQTECRYMQNEADAVKRLSFYVNNYVLFLAKKSPLGNKKEELCCCVLMFWTFLCCVFITLVTLDWFGGATRGNNFKKSCNTEALWPNGHTAVPLIALQSPFFLSAGPRAPQALTLSRRHFCCSPLTWTRPQSPGNTKGK